MHFIEHRKRVVTMLAILQPNAQADALQFRNSRSGASFQSLLPPVQQALDLRFATRSNTCNNAECKADPWPLNEHRAFPIRSSIQPTVFRS